MGSRPHLVKRHWCFQCYCPISGVTHRKIDRARQKRAWRKDWKL